MIGYIVGLFVIVLSYILFCFAPIITATEVEYGRVDGVGSVYNEGNSHRITASEFFGFDGSTNILIISFIAIAIAILGISYLKKAKKPTFLKSIIMFIVSFIAIAFPLIITIVCKNFYDEDMKFIGGSDAVYGDGVDAKYSGSGVIILLLCIVGAIILIYYFAKQAQLVMKPNEEEIKKASAVTNPDEWTY